MKSSGRTSGDAALSGTCGGGLRERLAPGGRCGQGSRMDDLAGSLTPHGAAVCALSEAVGACRICAERFAMTRTGHAPRPVPWLSARAPVLLAGQAPGARVHARGRPYDDPSGDRLRGWLGVDRAAFYDRRRFAVLPMAFCFPGYDAKGSDLPPPPVCAATWRARALAVMPGVRLTLLDRRLCPALAPGAAGRHGDGGGLAGRARGSAAAAAPVVAQYRVAEAQPVVRGGPRAGTQAAGLRAARRRFSSRRRDRRR